MALEWTQPLTEMSTRNLPGGGGGSRAVDWRVRLLVSPTRVTHSIHASLISQQHVTTYASQTYPPSDVPKRPFTSHDFVWAPNRVTHKTVAGKHHENKPLRKDTDMVRYY
jgi:hypothetical protein